VIDPTITLRVNSLTSNINDTMADRRFVAGMLLVFAIAVLLLTTVGTFGAMSYTVALRTREIGIRLAVGATPGGIWLGVERYVLAVVGAGAVVGLVVAWAASRLLSSLLYGLTPHDPLSFALAPLLVCAAGAAAAAWPAFRAARTDPSLSLRAE
jgi:putative ABC transport system permease protein